VLAKPAVRCIDKGALCGVVADERFDRTAEAVAIARLRPHEDWLVGEQLAGAAAGIADDRDSDGHGLHVREALRFKVAAQWVEEDVMLGVHTRQRLSLHVAEPPHVVGNPRELRARAELGAVFLGHGRASEREGRRHTATAQARERVDGEVRRLRRVQATDEEQSGRRAHGSERTSRKGAHIDSLRAYDPAREWGAGLCDLGPHALRQVDDAPRGKALPGVRRPRGLIDPSADPSTKARSRLRDIRTRPVVVHGENHRNAALCVHPRRFEPEAAHAHEEDGVGLGPIIEEAFERSAVAYPRDQVSKAIAPRRSTERSTEAKNPGDLPFGGAAAGRNYGNGMAENIQTRHDVLGQELVSTEDVRGKQIGDKMNLHRKLRYGRRQLGDKGSTLLGAALTLAACAPSLPKAPATPTEDHEFETALMAVPSGMDKDPPVQDVLRPGDLLSVGFVGEKDLEPFQTSVDRSGSVHLPLLGDVVVAGLTLTDAERTVQQGIRHYDRFVRVVLGIADAKGHVATVTGAVERPGNIPIVGDARLADVLGAAGGPKLSGYMDHVVSLGDVDGTRVVRDGVRLPIDARLALSGDPRHNVRIRPGDVIYVPPALDARIAVLGFVGKPETVAYHSGMRITEALAEAGGMTKSADLADIRVLRGGYAHPKVFVANARDIFTAKRPDVVLAPGDVIYVTEHWFASVTDVLDQLVPLAATATVAAVVATH